MPDGVAAINGLSHSPLCGLKAASGPAAAGSCWPDAFPRRTPLGP